MATLSEYAAIAEAVYDDAPACDGWSIAMGGEGRSGFRPAGGGLFDTLQAAAFSRRDEVIVAFRGTTLNQDWIANIKLGVGANTHQFSDAWRFVKDLNPGSATRMTLVGHSLGGAIAQVVGNWLRLPFVTFNAPGVALVSRSMGEMVEAYRPGGLGPLRPAGWLASAIWHPHQALRDLGAVGYWVSGLNLRLSGDVVSRIGVHYGDVVTLPAGDLSPAFAHLPEEKRPTLPLLRAHAMAAVSHVLRRDGQGRSGPEVLASRWR